MIIKRLFDAIENNLLILTVLTAIAISWGGLAQIVPLLFLPSSNTPIEGLKPLTALQLEGRDIYIREGCVSCHSQMIRTLRTETARYGPHSVSGEFVYDHPFLWGSKRTGPDLARIAGKYTDDWHRLHLFNPRAVVPSSNMPAFPWLLTNRIDGRYTADKMRALKALGVPYTLEEIEDAKEQVDDIREIDALIAYLQQLGLLRQRGQ